MIRTDAAHTDHDGDELLKTARDSRPGKSIKLRVQPGVYIADPSATRGGNYRSWPNVHWTLDCDTVREAQAVREALRAFFVQLSLEGPKAVEARLRQKEDAA